MQALGTLAELLEQRPELAVDSAPGQAGLTLKRASTIASLDEALRQGSKVCSQGTLGDKIVGGTARPGPSQARSSQLRE